MKLIDNFNLFVYLYKQNNISKQINLQRLCLGDGSKTILPLADNHQALNFAY